MLEHWQLVSGVVAGLGFAATTLALTRLPRTAIRLPLYVFVASGLLWAIGDPIASFAPDRFWKLVGVTILYTGSISLPALWWMVVLRWAEDAGAGLPLRAAAWRWLPLGWATLMWLAMLTNPWHGEFLTPVVGGRNLYQPLWYAMAIPNYGLIVAALGVEIAVARRVPRRTVRRQALYLIAASGVTMGSNLIYVAHLGSPNLTLAVLSISGALLVVGMARDGLFGVLPAALRGIAAHHPDGLVVVGSDGHVEYANERAQSLLAPLELRHDLELFLLLQHPTLRAERESDAATLDESAWWRALTSVEGVVLGQRAEPPRWLQLRASPVLRQRSSDGGYWIRISDVTARKQAERDARRTRRLESVAAVARTASREFQNTLAVIEGNALLLSNVCEEGTPAARRVARIVESARIAADLAHQLQLHAGSVDASRVPLELSAIVAETCGLVESDLPPGVSIELRAGDRELPVEADPIQIRQAVYNLLVNAIEASSEAGGTIGVAVGVDRVDPGRTDDLVCGAGQTPAEFAFVSVRDSAGGMEPETVERAFEPWFSTRGKDRGHGLSTVLGIARAHEALIKLENVEGRGCTLTLYFPLMYPLMPA
jgi:signal transduction histidine kinase